MGKMRLSFIYSDYYGYLNNSQKIEKDKFTIHDSKI